MKYTEMMKNKKLDEFINHTHEEASDKKVRSDEVKKNGKRKN